MYEFTNTPKPKYVQPAGEYPLQVVGFSLGMWPSGDTKVDLKILIEGTGTTFTKTLTPSAPPEPVKPMDDKATARRKQMAAFNRHECDQFLLAFDLVGEGALNTKVDLDNAEWLAANVVGNRSWGAVKIRVHKDDKHLPADEQRQYNDVDHWIIGKALPEAPAQSEIEPTEDNRPKF